MKPTAFVPPNIETLTPYVPGTPISEVERTYGLSSVSKLASNENLLGCSPSARRAAEQAIAEIHRYPDPGGFALKQVLASELGLPADELVLGSGSAELIGLLVRAFVTPGSPDEVLFGSPSFPVYGLETQALAARPVAVPLKSDFSYDVDRLLGAVSERTRLCFIANPNNPTGTYMPRGDFERLGRALPPAVILVADEAYFEYATASDYRSAMEMPDLRENLVVLRTFSKAYGLAGLRVGYAWAPAGLAPYLERVRPTFNVNHVAQAAAIAALQDKEHIKKTIAATREGLAVLTTGLDRLGLRTWPSQTNFVLADVAPAIGGKEARSGDDIYRELLAHGVIIRPIGQGSLIRITVGRPEENERVLTALEAVLRATKSSASAVAEGGRQGRGKRR